MKAVIVNEPGDFSALELSELPAPEPGPGEVLIDLAFCGCNWADTQIRKGTYPNPITYPIVLGYEGSGIIRACGEGVANLKEGDRVTAILPAGNGYAEQCVVDAQWVLPIPDEVALDQAAAFPLQAMTAYHILHTVHDLQEGETVLIHAAGGGVGICAVQLAVMAGARVIGTVGTPGKEKKPLAYGAEQVVNLNDDGEDFVSVARDLTAGRGVDLVVDSLGGETLDRSFDATRVLGQIVNFGEGQAVPFKNIRERVMLRSQNFCRFNIFHVAPGTESWNPGTAYVLQAIADGRMEVPIVATFPLEQAGAMHEMLEGRSVSGKLLLSMKT